MMPKYVDKFHEFIIITDKLVEYQYTGISIWLESLT